MNWPEAIVICVLIIAAVVIIHIAPKHKEKDEEVKSGKRST